MFPHPHPHPHPQPHRTNSRPSTLTRSQNEGCCRRQCRQTHIRTLAFDWTLLRKRSHGFAVRNKLRCVMYDATTRTILPQTIIRRHRTYTNTHELASDEYRTSSYVSEYARACLRRLSDVIVRIRIRTMYDATTHENKLRCVMYDATTHELVISKTNNPIQSQRGSARLFACLCLSKTTAKLLISHACQFMRLTTGSVLLQ